MKYGKTAITAQSVIDAINAGLAAGAENDDWWASQMRSVRITIRQAGSKWDFAGWRETANCLGYMRIVDEDRPAALGGVLYACEAEAEIGGGE